MARKAMEAFVDYSYGRIYIRPLGRLYPEELSAIRDAGFNWDKVNREFSAAWTPAREDTTFDLCDEIEETVIDTVDRAQLRAGEYNRRARACRRGIEKADAARAKIARTMQDEPLKVGHHSESRHRKDAAQLRHLQGLIAELYEKEAYWASRATATMRHAEERFTPGWLRRRIGELESEERKYARQAEDGYGHFDEVERRIFGRWLRFTQMRLDALRGELSRVEGESPEQVDDVVYSAASVAVGDKVLFRGHWLLVDKTHARSVRARGFAGNPHLSKLLPYEYIEGLQKGE